MLNNFLVYEAEWKIAGLQKFKELELKKMSLTQEY